MFRGVVPVECLNQILRLAPFADWPVVHVCCSGTLRFEAMLRKQFPKMTIIGNDVSLYSCAIGKLAAGRSFNIKFTGRLGFVEECLAENGGFLRRVAAVMVASDMAQYKGKNDYCRRHFAWYVENFLEVLAKTEGNLKERVVPIALNGFMDGDWRDHLKTAIANKAGIVGFPPFFKGDYEHMHAFIHENTEWPEPSYAIYDPKTLGEILDGLDAEGAEWCILSDQTFEDRPYLGKFVKGRKVPHYFYGTFKHGSLRVLSEHSSRSFRYKPIELSRITKNSQVKLTKAPSDAIRHVKDVFLAKNIVHTGGLFEYLVFLDDMLLGVLAYSLGKVAYEKKATLYLLSDVTTTSEAKLSKLMSHLALSQEAITPINHKMFERFEFVVTTARTKNPVSMKYRGIYRLLSRRPADPPEEGYIIQYGNDVKSEMVSDIFRWWWNKYGEKECKTALSQN